MASAIGLVTSSSSPGLIVRDYSYIISQYFTYFFPRGTFNVLKRFYCMVYWEVYICKSYRPEAMGYVISVPSCVARGRSADK